MSTYILKKGNRWNTFESIRKINKPILFIRSEKDTLVPPSHMVELHKCAEKSPRKEWHINELGDHNSNWVDDKLYFGKIKEFISKCNEGQ